MPSVSVIIPTFNRLERLKRVLAALETQDFPRSEFEVVVVADGCTDGTEQYLRSVRTAVDLVPVIRGNGGVAAARNGGIARARGELALFLDDDVVPTPGLISQHVSTHTSKPAPRIAVLGPMVTPPQARLAPWVRWEQAMLVKQYQDMQLGRWQPTARQFYTGNTSLPLREVREAGGFDPRFRRAEDVELAYRLAARGMCFVFNPHAVGYHYADRSFRSWLETPYSYGRSDVVFSRDLGQTWLLPRISYEYRYRRHHLIRGLVRLCLDRPGLSRGAILALTVAARAGDRLQRESISRLAYSGIFNLRNYQGMADELGGRDAFFASLADAAQTPVPGVLEQNVSIEREAR